MGLKIEIHATFQVCDLNPKKGVALIARNGRSISRKLGQNKAFLPFQIGLPFDFGGCIPQKYRSSYRMSP